MLACLSACLAAGRPAGARPAAHLLKRLAARRRVAAQERGAREGAVDALSHCGVGENHHLRHDPHHWDLLHGRRCMHRVLEDRKYQVRAEPRAAGCCAAADLLDRDGCGLAVGARLEPQLCAFQLHCPCLQAHAAKPGRSAALTASRAALAALPAARRHVSQAGSSIGAPRRPGPRTSRRRSRRTSASCARSCRLRRSAGRSAAATSCPGCGGVPSWMSWAWLYSSWYRDLRGGQASSAGSRPRKAGWSIS